MNFDNTTHDPSLPANCLTHELPNGLRVLLLPSSSQVVYCGIAVKAGSRHEQPGEEGLAHFCEHLSFKGTRRRSALQIINALEAVGGELNAFTGKEDTVYYAATTRQHLRRAVSVLLDIVFQSQYPQHEVEKECEVVCDEIDSYEDSPSELIFDEIENFLFEGHPLGHNILGTSQRVRSFCQENVQRFASRYYRPENCVLFVSGQVDMGTLVKMIGKMDGYDFRDSNDDRQSLKQHSLQPSAVPAPLITLHRGTHQAHVMMAARTFPASDERRWSLFLLNNILGGPGLNSRLNLALRERRGLVYTVESAMTTYSDTGVWGVYFGCDPHDVSLCRRLVTRELQRLIDHPLTDAQLLKAKQQLRGQLTIGAENREQQSLDMARSFLHEQRVRTLKDVLAHVDALSAADLQHLAAQLLSPERLTTLIYDS